MSTSLHSYFAGGGGNVAYVFFVAGYPWAVTDRQELVDLLHKISMTDDAKYLRKKMFGGAYYDPSYGYDTFAAYDVTVFKTLLTKGSESWRLDESKGIIQGSKWSVTIQDATLDNEHYAIDRWPHKADGDEIWGLDGLHRVPVLEDSTVHGWGYLEVPLPRLADEASGLPPEYLVINEKSPGTLYNRVDNLSAGQVVYLWLGQECIAVDGIYGSGPWTADDPIYQLSIVQDNIGKATGRGIWKTRPHNHKLPPAHQMIEGPRTLISDTPPSIIDRYAYLYAVPLDDDGGLLYDSDGNPVWGMIRDPGVVSSSIKTQNSVTTVDVHPSTKALELDISLVQEVAAIEEHLGGYTFTRHIDAGTDESTIVPYWQSPHLVIAHCGWDINGIPDMEKFPIWLCDRGESITFNSFDDLIEATKNEIQRVIDYSDNQHTGSGTAADNPGYSKPTRSGARSRYVASSGAVFEHPTIEVAGPLAWIIGMGYPATNGSIGLVNPWVPNSNSEDMTFHPTVDEEALINGGYADRYERFLLAPNMFMWFMEFCGYKMSYTNPFYGYQQWLNINSFFDVDVNKWGWDQMPGIANEAYRAKYYTGWNWPNQEIPEWNYSTYGIPSIQQLDKTSYFYFAPCGDDSPTVPILSLQTGADIDAFVDDEVVAFGNNEGQTIAFEATMDGNGFTDSEVGAAIQTDDDRLEVISDDPIIPGWSLFYIPITMASGDPEATEDTVDPYTIQKKKILHGASLSDVIKCIMGYNNTGMYLAPELTLSYVPLFATSPAAGPYGVDHVSVIDYDSMDANLGPITSNQFYYMDTGDLRNVYDLLKNEVLLHACSMTREWDPENCMFRWRFRKIEAINNSEAYHSGRVLNESNIKPGRKIESHNYRQIANAIDFKARPLDENRYNTIDFPVSGDTTVAMHLATQRMEVKPALSRFNITDETQFDTAVDLKRHMKKMLRTLSRMRTANSCQCNHTAVFSLALGRECLVTDPAARTPYTHALVLDEEPARITSWRYNIDRDLVDVSFVVGGDASYGWAPSCRIESGNFTTHTTYWKGVPNDHDFSRQDQAKDIYRMDCFDLWNPSNPTVRSCGCGNYSVFAFEEGADGASALEFTCNVQDDGGTDTLFLTGSDTAFIDTDKDYIIRFAAYDDCEECQQKYIFGADSSLTIGSGNVAARKWVG